VADVLAALWNARSVAVVGASTRPGALGRLPVEFLLRYGYDGRIVPVHPTATEIAGVPAFRSVASAPGPVDLAMILVPAAAVPAAVEDCAHAAVPVVVLCSAGFAETGVDGAALQAALVKQAHAKGVRLVGPNCIGSVGVARGQVASFSPLFAGASTTLVDGPLGFVTQSGALGYGAVSLAYERGLGLGRVVNTGNEADVGAAEVLAAMAAEPDCRGLLAYVEQLSDVAGLARVAATGVPLAVLKAGRGDAGQRAAASHTGALAAGDRVVDAVLHRHGVVRVDDIDELLDVGAAFAQPRRPAGPRVAVVTTSGGSGILAADAIDGAGLELAELAPRTTEALRAFVPAFGSVANPVDVTATVMADPTLFDRALDTLVDDHGVDAVVACFCVLTGDDVAQVVGGLARVAERSGKPVVAARTGADHLAPGAAAALQAAGIPVYPTPARAVRALDALRQVALPRRTAAPSTGAAAEPPLAPQVPPPADPPPADPPPADEVAMKRLLAAAGVQVPRGRLVADGADAVTAVDEVGGRAVLKAVAPGLVHKTEANGVVLDVTVADAASVHDRLAGLGGTVLVEEQIPAGVEVLVGVTSTPLGAVLAVGPGGVLTEVLDDVALAPLPVTHADVEDLVDRTRLGRLLAGVRGRPAADRTALVDLVVRVSALAATWVDGHDLDCNPVVALPDRAVVLDAVLVCAADRSVEA